MSPTVIRTMQRDDVPGVCAVDRHCFPQPWADTTFLAEITNTVGYYRVAEAGGEIVGYIGSHIIIDEAHVTTFGVRPDLRRRHIGERLLVDVLEQALRSGCRRVTLEVRESNEGAIRLYRKYGFAPVTRRRGYYEEGEDAVVMWIEDMSRLGFRTLFDERRAALGQ